MNIYLYFVYKYYKILRLVRMWIEFVNILFLHKKICGKNNTAREREREREREEV